MARKPPRSSNGPVPTRRLAVMNLALRGIEADFMLALPGQLFYSTQIPVCLWFCGKRTRAILRTMPVCSMAKRNSAW